MKRGFLNVNGMRLAFVDYGGAGPHALLLHGLFGNAATWAGTAWWLTPYCHVVALDQRGHGWSDKPDNAYSREEYAADAQAAIEQLGLAPALVIGHSMGALNAWVLASRRPDLVRGLVVEDMSAQTYSETPGEDTQEWLAGWPLPFPTMEVMVHRADGWRPQFQPEHMVESARQIHLRDHWDELRGMRCPTLVVKGGNSDAPAAELKEMARLCGGGYVEVPGAGHVVHHERPAAWREAVEPFARELTSPA